MEKKFDLITDSCCDLPYSYLAAHDVAFVSMCVTIDGQEYIDDLGETLQQDWLIEQLRQEKMPTTSQINIGTYMEAFQNYLDHPIPVIYLAFSSALSGSHQSAVIALHELQDRYGKKRIPITIIDTKIALF